MPSVYKENVKVFKALCDEKRLLILELLRSGEKCACVLIEKMDMPQSTLSYHMKILCDSGIVRGRQEGKWTHYSICPDGSARAKTLLDSLLTTNTEKADSDCKLDKTCGNQTKGNYGYEGFCKQKR